MNKMESVFQNQKALLAFLTAGDPSLDKTEDYILTMEQAGMDLLLLGIPFSDPIAEGPVIQESNLRALANGCTTDRMFDMLLHLRQKTDLPICLYCYLNTIYKYGYERFFSRCKETGISAVQVPDMPFEEQAETKEAANRYDVKVISYLAPASNERMQKIASNAEGFLYLVTSSEYQDAASMVQAAKEVTDVPVVAGCSIASDIESMDVCSSVDGVLIDFAVEELIASEGENAEKSLYELVKKVKEKLL